jgi:hypothetical protein
MVLVLSERRLRPTVTRIEGKLRNEQRFYYNVPRVGSLKFLLASARSPCGGGAGLGWDRARADLMVRWRALGRAQARLGAMAAGGRWFGAVARGAGTLRLGRPKTRGPLAGTLVVRARSGRLAAPD